MQNIHAVHVHAEGVLEEKIKMHKSFLEDKFM